MTNSLLILLLSPLLSFAGTPDQDPVVKAIRSKMASGAVPQISDLEPGAKWECIEIDAETNDLQQSFVVLSFESFDGLVQPINWERDANSRRSDNDQKFGVMAFTNSGLVGPGYTFSRRSTMTFMLLRVDRSGNLVIENSVPVGFDFVEKPRYPVSAIYGVNNRALTYYICPKDKILP